MRTLVVSDFHLGLGPRYAVLECPRPLDRLVAALETIDRLVLLGDTVELVLGSARARLEVVRPVLRAIGQRLGRSGRVVLVPGNHDRALLAGWLAAHRLALEPDTEAPLDASPVLARLADWLAPASVRVHYPGVWLADGVWATHGHYLDRHLLPDRSYGVARGLLRRLPSDGARPGEYERSRGRSTRRLRERLPALTRWPLEPLLEFVRAVSMPVAPGRLVSPRLALVTAPLLGLQMRRAAIPALARVVHRLGIDAHTVVFGHVHRLGPLPGDDRSLWQDPTGHAQILNCGSWVYEPLLLHHAAPPHPYWPGGAVRLEDGREPVAVGLLDDLGVQDLHGPRQRALSH